MVYVKNYIAALYLNSLSIHNHESLLLGTFYIPPGFKVWGVVDTSIDHAMGLNRHLVMLGDFKENLLVPTKSRNITHILNIFNLSQVIQEPTRV